MKAVMLSIQPKWCEKIASGEKTFEVRKTRPKIETPFPCFIYETQGETETPWIDEDGHEIFKPAADVVLVVRCKDCKYRNPDGYKCRRDNLWHASDDFCSYGMTN